MTSPPKANLKEPSNLSNKTKLRAGLQIASTLIHGSRDLLDPYANCLRNAIMSADNFADVELIMDDLSENMPTNFTCADLTGAVARATLNLVGKEAIIYDRKSLDATTSNSTIAGVILHEVAHNKNYSHHDSDRQAGVNLLDDYKTTVTNMVNACVSGTPAGGRRGGSAQSSLAPIGTNLGSFMPNLTCFSNMVANGIKVRSDGRIHGMGLKCLTPNATTVADTALGGNATGSITDLPCGFGEVLVGLQARRSGIVQTLAPLCARETDVRAKNSAAVLRGSIGTGSGGIAIRQCPTGMAVKGFRGRFLSIGINRIELMCQPMDVLQFFAETPLAAAGSGTTATGADVRVETCARRGALVGLNYNVGAAIDRLGGKCDGVFTDCIGGGICTDFSFGTDRHSFPSHGGWGGTNMQDMCPSLNVLVGLDVTFTSVMTSIKGKCAPIQDWSVPSRSVTVTELPRRGDGGGTLTQFMCPRGRSLIGWKLASFDMVNGLQPICRDFN